MRETPGWNETCLAECIHLSIWCGCKTAGDMCVADPSTEQPLNSMESCTSENNDSTAMIDNNPPANPCDDGCSELRISEVFSLEQESQVKETVSLPENEKEDITVVIVEDENEQCQPGQTNEKHVKRHNGKSKTKGVKEAKGDDVQIIEISDVQNDTDKVSAEVISEIDKEILKSLEGTFKNLKTLIHGIEKETGGKGPAQKRPRSGPVFGTSKGGVQVKPVSKTTDSLFRKVLDKGKNNKTNEDWKSNGGKTVNTDNTENDAWSWKKEYYVNILDENKPRAGKSAGVKRKRSSTEEQDKTTEIKAKDEKQEEDVVWICFVCAKGFSNQQELMSHQDTCEEDLPQPDISAAPLGDCTHRKEQNPGTFIKPELASDDLHITQISKPDRVSFDSPLSEASIPVPARLTKVGSGIKSLPLGLPRKRKIPRRKIVKEIYIPPPRDTYFQCLGLGHTPAMDEIFKSPRKSVSEDDCAIIDLTVDDAKAQHSSPMTPRSRSLMSQLSRDESGRRRQLSFSGTPKRPEPKPQTNQVDVDKKESSDSNDKKESSDSNDKNESSDSESSEGSEEESATRKSIPFKSALLAIPLTSPLGLRLKNHLHNESKVPIISNVEAFCGTDGVSDIDMEIPDKKNPVLDKLRHRPPPQVTFKFTKKYLNKWFHKYKFNDLDKHEFNKILKTGLERESRKLAKQMKPCKVLMQRLGVRDIKYWTTPRVRKPEFRYIQFCQSYPNNNNPRFRINPQTARTVMRSSQRMMFNQMNPSRLAAPILLQPHPSFKLQPSRMPTPQFLVRPHGGGNGMRLEVMNINQGGYTPMHSLLAAQLADGTAQPVDRRNQKRKQTFHNVRQDDNLVICLSSDEEDDAKKASTMTQCAQCKTGVCSVHQNAKTGSVIPAAMKMTSLVPSSRGNSVKSGNNSPDCASSRVSGNSFLQNAGRAGPTKPASSNFLNIRMVNGQVYHAQTEAQTSTSPGGPRSQAPASQNVSAKSESSTKESSIKDELVPDTAGNGRSQSDSEYMDYEVICIESDDED